MFPILCFAQRDYSISTVDIDHFWAAYDRLKTANTRADSNQVMQEYYIDQATKGFRKFIRIRDFKASEYLALIRRYPDFWKSVRPLTEKIAGRTAEIEKVFDRFAQTIPGFKPPDVCFAIGCLRTGGTVAKGMVLIGAEIAAADESVDKSNLNPWLQNVLGQTGDIVAMVAHEAVHTQQSGIPFMEIFSLLNHKKLSLMNMAIIEGSADFITQEMLGLHINASLYSYGEAQPCVLWNEFKADCERNPFDYTKWLYNGLKSTDRPADLAYYIGHKISAHYYGQSPNKEKALKKLLKRGKYKRVLKQSGYDAICNP